MPPSKKRLRELANAHRATEAVNMPPSSKESVLEKNMLASIDAVPELSIRRYVGFTFMLNS
jgi:hypothetical protein